MQNNFEKLSLSSVNIEGNVLGKFSTFSILQEYKNNTDAVLEVTYTFPVSASATITGFIATVGGKTIKGKVKAKEEAEKDYQRAMVRGDSAYMMTNDESNIFRMNIGKIAIEETVIVKIDYIDNFEIVDNQLRMLIPTLVPPRYKSDVTDQLTYNKGEIEYRGNIFIHIDKDMKIDDIVSRTHNIKLENNTVSAKNIKLDRDFVLDIKLAEQTFSKGYYHELPNGKKVVYLSFFPDIEVEKKVTSKDYVFVIDISGSMSGFKLEQTKEAVLKCLKQLNKGDKFNIIAFDHVFETFADKIKEFNADTYKEAKKYIQSLRARGGTEILEPIKHAIQESGEEKIIFLFTDGAIGYEDQVAGWVRQNIGKNALFIFGIDSSVNKKGLAEIAEAGRGKAEFIVKDEQIKEIIVRQFARVSLSNLFEINLNTKTNKTFDRIEKSRVLFNHEFYDVLVEVEDLNDDFELICKTDKETFSFPILKNSIEQSALPLDKIYASEKIKKIEKYIEACRSGSEGYKEQIVEIAVQYQIDSKYTAFIAINERDEKLTDIPDLQETVLESPKGWDMMKGQSMNLYMKTCKLVTNSDRLSMRCSSTLSAKEEHQRERIRKSIDKLFKMIVLCEKLLRNNLKKHTNILLKLRLKFIIYKLKPHLSAPSEEYRVLFERMKQETPLVYKQLFPVQ
ncbi:MAG: VWA domain-containing protein [Dysgonamonadaceae bacterium]|jgi:Ca-activated chloride channel family protein|nr:VWA domain-containing protein [Dysgonamonadaceae bacterium]